MICAADLTPPTEEALKVLDKNSTLYNLFETAINSAKDKASKISHENMRQIKNIVGFI